MWLRCADSEGEESIRRRRPVGGPTPPPPGLRFLPHPHQEEEEEENKQERKKGVYLQYRQFLRTTPEHNTQSHVKPARKGFDSPTHQEIHSEFFMSILSDIIIKTSSSYKSVNMNCRDAGLRPNAGIPINPTGLPLDKTAFPH